MNRLLHVARPQYHHARQRGAAILVALLTVVFVALFATSAFWYQWREIETESAERSRIQANWILTGARDWGRAILREDARTGGTDNLTEAWAAPMPDTPLSAFLALDTTTTDTAANAFIAIQINDLQARLNITNLIGDSSIAKPALQSFTKLFTLLELEPAQLNLLVESLTALSGQASSLMPHRTEQLARLGLTSQTISVLKPYVTLLPETTPLNINTASAIVICASIESLDLASAQQLVVARDSTPFRSMKEAVKVLGDTGDQLADGRHSVASRYFELNTRLRLDQSVVSERAVLFREKTEVKTLWREQEAQAEALAISSKDTRLTATAR